MKKTLLVLLAVVALVAALAAAGYLPKARRDEAARHTAAATAARVPAVRTVPAGLATDTLGLTLPGRIEAQRSTDLFARAQGYVRRWTADLGQRVRRGQLLAEITQPELAQDVAAAQSQLTLARANLRRLESVSLPGAISQAELDQARAQYKAAQAALKRLQDVQGFQQITAPFDGVVTARNLEVGAYVGPGTTPLYSLQSTAAGLRVYVDVPQAEAGRLLLTGHATLRVPERPAQVLTLPITRNAGSFDPATRTLTVQLDLPADKAQGLAPGMYAQVTFAAKPEAGQGVRIPANALYYAPEGPAVLVVERRQTIAFRPITIGQDFGTYVVAAQGVAEGEALVVNPSSRLVAGTRVQVLPAEPEPANQKGGH